MSIADFSSGLARLTLADVRRISASLESESAGDEVDAWRATMAIDRALRHSHSSRRAAHAAWDAAQIVQHVAAQQGAELPDPEVTRVARAAAEIARGLVAGEDVAREVSELARHWLPVLVRV